MEAAKASLMPVGKFSIETVEERMMEARRIYKLNLGSVVFSSPCLACLHDLWFTLLTHLIFSRKVA